MEQNGHCMVDLCPRNMSIVALTVNHGTTCNCSSMGAALFAPPHDHRCLCRNFHDLPMPLLSALVTYDT